VCRDPVLCLVNSSRLSPPDLGMLHCRDVLVNVNVCNGKTGIDEDDDDVDNCTMGDDEVDADNDEPKGLAFQQEHRKHLTAFKNFEQVIENARRVLSSR